MKKTSIALLIGLFAIGCEKAPTKAAPPSMPDTATMSAHMGRPAEHGAAPAMKDDEKTDDGEKTPAADPATPEEPK